MTNLIMAAVCITAATYCLDRAPRLSGWLVAGAGLYALLWFGSI